VAYIHFILHSIVSYWKKICDGVQFQEAALFRLLTPDF